MKKSRPATPDEDIGEDATRGVDVDAVERLEAEEMQNILDLPTCSVAPPGLGIGIVETVKKCLDKGG